MPMMPQFNYPMGTMPSVPQMGTMPNMGVFGFGNFPRPMPTMGMNPMPPQPQPQQGFEYSNMQKKEQ